MSTTQVAPVNYWPDTACAKAFWGQRELPAYRRLLADTVAWLDPKPRQRWIDLGCGGGQLTRALWEKSHGTLAEIVALDCAAANEKAIRKLRDTMSPPAAAGQVRFLHADFSSGLRSALRAAAGPATLTISYLATSAVSCVPAAASSSLSMSPSHRGCVSACPVSGALCVRPTRSTISRMSGACGPTEAGSSDRLAPGAFTICPPRACEKS